MTVLMEFLAAALKSLAGKLVIPQVPQVSKDNEEGPKETISESSFLAWLKQIFKQNRLDTHLLLKKFTSSLPLAETTWQTNELQIAGWPAGSTDSV